MTECPWCFKYLSAEMLAPHQHEECSGRVVNCRFDGCKATFREEDRAMHERDFCKARRHRDQFAKSALKQLELIDCPNEMPEDKKFALRVSLQRAEMPEPAGDPVRAAELRFQIDSGTCGHRVARKHMQRHALTECRLRPSICYQCGLAMKAFQIGKHLSDDCPMTLRRNEMIAEHTRKGMAAPCPDCGQEVKLRNMPRHLKEECACRPARCRNQGCGATVMFYKREEHERKFCGRVTRRDELVLKRDDRFGPGKCPQCTNPIALEKLKYHLEHQCPLRMVKCSLFGCGMEIPLGDLPFHQGETRVPCFMCHKPTPGGNSRFIFMSNGPLKTVLVTSHDPIPKDTVHALDQIVGLWKKHPKLRRRVLASFQRDHADIYALPEVHPLFDLDEAALKKMDSNETKMLELKLKLKECNHSVLATDAEKQEKERVTKALEKVMAGRWEALFEKIKVLSSEMAICAKIGKRGKVVVTEITCCERCIHDPNMIPPLTDISQYRSNAVCPVLFKREQMILQREENAAYVDCPRGCGHKVQRRHVQSHLRKECSLRTVKCQWPACGLVYKWRDRRLHREKCTHYVSRNTMAIKRLIRLEEKTCSWCSEFKGTSAEVGRHETTECPLRYVACSNVPSCGEYVLAKDQELHNLICGGTIMKRNREMSDRFYKRRIASGTASKDFEWFWEEKLRKRAYAEERLGQGDEVEDESEPENWTCMACQESNELGSEKCKKCGMRNPSLEQG